MSRATGYIKDRPELLGRGKRLIRCFMYAHLVENDNPYAHPLDFTASNFLLHFKSKKKLYFWNCAVADVISGKVVDIEDLPVTSGFGSAESNGKRVTVPRTPVNYDPDLLPSDFMRRDVKPLQVLSPSGPSFVVDGNLIKWQKFSFRVGFNYREGLVLHDVKYQDGPKTRPLFYRMALAEMTVPYGDPRPPYHVKCVIHPFTFGCMTIYRLL